MIIIERQVAGRGGESLFPHDGFEAGFGLVIRRVRIRLLTQRAQPDVTDGLPVGRLRSPDHEHHIPNSDRRCQPAALMLSATMTLYLHRAERADRLVTALGDLLSTPLTDPFATEIISVPTHGVERWLSQGLAQRLRGTPGPPGRGCVGVDFPSPRRLVARALAGSAEEEDADPWQPHRAVWPLLRVIDACRGEPWAALLWHYLGGNGRSTEQDPLRTGRRWSTARHLAGLFARYATTRPTMIDSWSQGNDVDAWGSSIPADRAWQAELWRRLRRELAGPGPAECVQAA